MPTMQPRSIRRTRTRKPGTVALLLVGIATPASADDTCAALEGLRIEDTNLHSAVTVPAANGLPAYCRVLGEVRPSISFEARLPLEGWNGKFYMAGCGGFCGRLDADRPGFTNSINHGLRRGYAVATMDGGHWGTGPTDGRWAWENRLAEIDWGWRAVTETARVGKRLIAEHYGRAHQRAYFAGCSTGGRMALMSAQRFPADFDGIIAGAPALDYTGLVATQAAWITQANTDADGQPILARDKVPAIAAAVTAACDELDGRRDGLIDDPRECRWSPAELRCGKDAQAAGSETCLSDAEVRVVERWYSPPRNSAGTVLYPGGVPRGSEPFWPLWLSGFPAQPAIPALVPLFARDFLRYMAFAEDPGDTYAVTSYDFDRDPPRLAAMSPHYDATSPALEPFRERGGKLLIYHGWADPIVTPQRTLDYYAELERRFGAAPTREFTRLFMLPGFDHCGIQAGAGANDAGFDPLPALEAWVEQGVAPERIDTRRVDAQGKTAWQAPVCAWPRPGADCR